MAWAEYIHATIVALTTGINAISVGIGQGRVSKAAIEAMNQQPSARNDINRAMIMGLALIETVALMGIFVSIMLLWRAHESAGNPYATIAEIGIAFAICSSGMVLGFVSSLPAQAACRAIARQPFFSWEIIRFMMVSLSLLQTPIIFGLIVSLLIQNQAASVNTMRDALRLIASGFCIGVGSIGPAIGLALFGQKACQGLGVNRHAYRQIFSFTLLSQAIIETPIIFSLVISFALLLLVPSVCCENIVDGIALLAAGLCTGIGTLGPGLSSGRTARTACEQITHNPESYGSLSRISMFAQGLIDTSAIYALLISFLLLFFRS